MRVMKLFTRLLAIIIFCLVPGILRAQDIYSLGGDLTSSLAGRAAIQVTAPNISSEELRIEQLAGFGVFHRFSSVAEGRGPRFNSDGCGSCHVDNGRGPVGFSSKSRNSTMVIKVSLAGRDSGGAPRNVPGVGEQLQDHEVGGGNLYRVKLRWKEVDGFYPDGTRYHLRRPNLDFSIPGVAGRRVRSSLRMTPIVIGPGLLEAVPEAAILAMSDPFDVNHDGISGKPQYVPDRRHDTFAVGRYGFKASHPTVEQQTAAAAAHDIGLTNVLFPAMGSAPELSEADLRLLVVYQMLAGVPYARAQEDPRVQAGKNLFQRIGCDGCHLMTMVTGGHEFVELRNQVIHPFTDLLLHDMGRGLADKRAEFSSSGSEWRTTPLWGLGYSRRISKVQARFLHDGRARTIEEAILWHGGEASASRREFIRLSKEQRQQLLAFLDSL